MGKRIGKSIGLSNSRIMAGLQCPKRLYLQINSPTLDEALLAVLPAGVDPCGENGEFHTFVYDGPMFQEPIRVVVGERIVRDGFVFADVRVG